MDGKNRSPTLDVSQAVGLIGDRNFLQGFDRRLVDKLPAN